MAAFNKTQKESLKKIEEILANLHLNNNELQNKMDTLLGEMNSNQSDLQRLKEKQMKLLTA